MCGFAGFLDVARAIDEEGLGRVARAMSNAIGHRGPDDAVTWTDVHAGVALGFRRLAVQDLSAAGRQPMVSRSGRYVLLFNGELYNASALRVALASEGVQFAGYSDTEVLLAQIDRSGFPGVLPLLRGMFALACWDRKERALHLARDPAGKKPLYFGSAGRAFLFASQPKAFFAHPAFRPSLDRDALCAFFRFGYVPAPLTIFHGFEKLRAGEYVAICAGRIALRQLFWDCAAEACEAMQQPQNRREQDAADELELRLGDAVERRLASDVPVGAFLSGGLDSSTVVALMRARSHRKVKTFCVGFDDPGYDESSHALAVATHLGTEHHTLRADRAALCDVVPRMPDVYDEPFADPSQVPTYILSRLARSHVTVALSGDGGDELFGGYTRYAVIEAIGRVQSLPPRMRRALALALHHVPPFVWRTVGSVLPRGQGLSRRVLRLGDMLNLGSLECQYRDLVGQWSAPGELVPGAREPVAPLWTGALRDKAPDTLRLAQLIDLLSYLPDDILVKVDRASMAVGLEVRAPLLDLDVMQFAWSLPREQLVRPGASKWLLRQVLYRHVPPQLVDRPKMGFGCPVAGLLRAELREWAESLLDPSRMRAAGIVDPAPIMRTWEEHKSGRIDWSTRIWSVLMLEAWLQTYRVT